MIRKHRRFYVLSSLTVLLLAGLCQADGPAAVDFTRDVRPILSDKCFFCHGPDENRREADLRLDLRDDAFASGVFDGDDSSPAALIERIESDDVDLRMPPPDSHKSLTSDEKAILRRWVEQGAEYAAPWAFTAPQRSVPPAVTHDGAILRNPIDHFIQSRLFAQSLTPAPEANRATLIRRVSLDLIGLPPMPSDVDAFVNDDQPGAYERLVDRLLESPRYGERMATPWLDVVRYADTVGFHGDQNQNAWAYRDYVIESFNKNKPFDQFTIEQIAGDLLPNPTSEQRVATCFNRLNMMTREGGAQPKEYLSKYAADRVRTVSMAWLGLTFGCAECHDHKFDPISAKDFYSLAAFFADVRQWGVYMEYEYTPNPEFRGFSNDSPFPPESVVESPYLLEKIRSLHAQIDRIVENSFQAIATDPAQSAEFATWVAERKAFLAAHPDGWIPLTPETTQTDTPKSKKSAGTPTESEIDPSHSSQIVFDGKTPKDDVVTFQLAPGRYAALRLELLPKPDVTGTLLRDGTKGSALVRLELSLQKDRQNPRSIRFRHAAADFYEPQYRNGFEITDILGGWKTAANHTMEPQTGIWLFREPIVVTAAETLMVTLPKNRIGCVQISVTPLAPLDTANLAVQENVRFDSHSSQNESGTDAIQEQYLRSTSADRDAYRQFVALDEKLIACRHGETPVMVTEAITPMTTRILPRGDWQDESGEIVSPATPHFLPSPASSSEPLTRLDLAHWLVSAENPLPSRVVMNRFWKQLFGRGLCASVDDFGAQGEVPTHPELLDWLAIDFREHGWDIKRAIKQIVMSHTYQQSSQASLATQAIDPENRLLSHQNPRRLEAEFVRDNALAISGLLNADLGGPPAMPYQPAGYYESLQFPDRNYVAETDERQYRRGVYAHWQRTFGPSDAGKF